MLKVPPMPPQLRFQTIATFFFIFSMSILWAIAHAHAEGNPDREKCIEVLLQRPSGPMVGPHRGKLEETKPVKIVLPEKGPSSVLYYYGELPNTETQELFYKKYRVHFARHDRSGVVAIISRNGLSHKTLNRIVPDGASLLGGTQYPWGKSGGRRNSEYFGWLHGEDLETRFFEVSFD